MSKKKNFFSPSQMMILEGGTTINEGSPELDWAKPNPNLDDEDDEIILPDGSVGVSDGEVIIPDTSSGDGIAADEAYY